MTDAHSDAATELLDDGGPLAGYVVLDLTRALAGPHAAMMLGDLGARVIKVEMPGTGDDSRGYGPPFAGPEDDPVSTYYLCCNRNKESITVDLRSPEGVALIERLVRRVDVVAENFRVGVLDRLGLSHERMRELNPRLVVLSISGFGHDGPEGGRPGYDQIAQGEGGLMSVTGQPGHPTRAGLPVADVLAGIHGAYGVLAALLRRERTGRGTVVRTSLLASIVGVHAYYGTQWTVGREIPVAPGNYHPSIAPYGLFHAADGALQMTISSERLWRVLAGVLGMDPDEPRFATNRDRVAHRDELIERIEGVFATGTVHEWLARLDAAGIPCGLVRTMDQVYEWEQTRSQGLVLEVDHPVLGPIELPGPPVRFEDGARAHHRPPPGLGEHDESVRRWLDELDARDLAGRAAAGPGPGGAAG